MRVVTYNTQGSLGMDGVRSTARIADALRPLSAEVVCFQEIYQRLPPVTTEDQPALLSSLLNRRFVFQRCLDFAFGGYGIGIAAQSGHLESYEHMLPAFKEQRGALEVRLRDIGGLHSVTIFCTHWGLHPDERLLQAEKLAGAVKAAPRPIIVCGDLNEEAGGAAVQLLLERTGLVDSDAAQNRATFVSENPTVRIDYILHSEELRVTHCEVVSSMASDHLPFLADLEVAGD